MRPKSLLILIIPTKIARLELSGKFPVGLGIQPLNIKIMFESDPLKSRILVRRLAVCAGTLFVLFQMAHNCIPYL